MILWLMACVAAEPEPQVHVEEAPLQVQTDPTRLRTLVQLPDGFGEPRWVVRPVGLASAAPGPSDHALVLWLPVPTPGALDVLGPAGSARPATLDEAVATALLPTALLASLRLDGGKRMFSGPSYSAAAFERMPFRAQRAVGVVMDGQVVGLLVWLHTM